MKPFLFLLTAALLCGSAANAQPAQDSIKAVINGLFTAMKNNDSALLKNSFSENAILQTIAVAKDGSVSVKTEAVDDFVNSVTSQFKGALDERITFEGIKIDGALASVWTPYHFFYNKKFIHCGVNSFQLVRINNIWKIQYLIDTRRKTGCNEKASL